MKPLPESAIRARTSSKVYARGEDYFAQGMVSSLVRRGRSLHARVEGSEGEPYRVSVQWQADGAVEADCTCPFMEEWDGWCKHIVAALIHYEEEQGDVPNEKTVGELLRPLKREALLDLMVQLIEYDPTLYEVAVELMNGREPSHQRKEEEWD